MSARSRTAPVVGLLVLLAAACGDSGAKTATQTFHSTVYGYTVSYPANWVVEAASHVLDDGQPPATSGGGTDILSTRGNLAIEATTLPRLVVGGQRVPPTVTLDTWTSNVTGTVSFMKACPQPDAREPLTVGGEKAMLLRYDDCPKGSGLFHFWVATVHKGTGYHIVWFDQRSQQSGDRAAFDKMLASLTFT